jgi:CPA2 family monovalent cation:H+ antiporter-2
VTVLVVSVVFLALFWRKLIRWYSHFQYSFNLALAGNPTSLSSTVTPQQSEFWHVQLAELVLPDHAACRLRTIAQLDLRRQFGCSIVEIERHGERITNPAPDTTLYPGDQLLLFGASRQIKLALEMLQQEVENGRESGSLSESRLETVVVRASSGKAGRTLAQLRIFASTGVQVLGVERDGQAALNPAADHELRAGDRLLILSTAAQAREFQRWLDA